MFFQKKRIQLEITFASVRILLSNLVPMLSVTIYSAYVLVLFFMNTQRFFNNCKHLLNIKGFVEFLHEIVSVIDVLLRMFIEFIYLDSIKYELNSFLTIRMPYNSVSFHVV